MNCDWMPNVAHNIIYSGLAAASNFAAFEQRVKLASQL